MNTKQARICELRQTGMTMTQVAKEVGCSKSYVKQVCVENGIRIPLKCDPAKLIEKREPQFEYVDGFTNCDGMVNIRCKVCGHVQSRSLITIRHQKNIECDNCKRIASEEKAEQEEQQRRLAKEKREHLSTARRKAKQLSFSVCKGCGCLFFPSRLGLQYCSVECQKRTLRAIGKDKRIKKLASIVVDRDITLEALYRNSNGECALCGGKCNWGDHVVRDDGTFVVGAMYPSIDHIQPISKGGKHEWSNVQLAHHYCNTLKGNRP